MTPTATGQLPQAQVLPTTTPQVYGQPQQQQQAQQWYAQPQTSTQAVETDGNQVTSGVSAQGGNEVKYEDSGPVDASSLGASAAIGLTLFAAGLAASGSGSSKKDRSRDRSGYIGSGIYGRGR
jgi:hypothetical protein